MFARISKGWALTKTSFHVLMLDKEMLALPLVSGVLLLVLTASFFVPMGFLMATTSMAAEILYLGLFAFYVVTYFVILWFNTAIVEMATIRFNGGDPVLKDGLKKAWENSWRIFQWAVVAATVGLLLKVLDGMARRSSHPMVRMIGTIGVSLVGLAWNLATFFVVPILIYQGLGPWQAVKSSAAIWKRTWGEQLTAVFSTGLVFGLLALLGVVILFVGAMAGTVTGLLVGLAVAVAWWVLLWCANTAMDGIIVAALYKYAVDGQLPEAFKGTIPPAVATTPAPAPRSPYA